jgi:chromosomal replication initiator protein
MISITHQPSVRVEPCRSVHITLSASVEIPTGRLGFCVVPRKSRVTVLEIQKLVSRHFKLPLEDMASQRRSRGVARPRQVSMWLCRQLTTRSYPDIGRRHGNRDHTTVLHAFRKIEALKAVDPVIAYDCAFLVAELGGLPE